jgi:alpha-galactosidase/6-phospho-beta-glucosidase family protein
MSKAIDVALKTMEQMHEREANTKLTSRMKKASEDAGAVDTFRNNVLSQVSSENYERAIEEIKTYQASKSEYPLFRARAERYSNYAIDLINAIKAKRSFPGLQHLGMSKQQELFDRAMEHFEDLKVTLRKVEQVDREVRLDDVRSTVWVVKAVIYSFFALVAVGILIEMSHGVLPSLGIVVDDVASRIINHIFDSIGI